MAHAAAVQPSVQPIADAEYARRLSEMASTQALGQRRWDLEQVPMLTLPAKAAKQPSKSPTPPAVDWRQIVEHIRRTKEEAVSGRQMLTDTFG